MSSTDHITCVSGGRVLFFSTSITKFASVPPVYLLYAATKGAVEQMVRILAKDLGARGITVNAVAPGPTDTDLFRNGKNDAQFKFFENLHPAKRIAKAEEIAPMVAFLCHEEAGWVNGQTHFVNGVSAIVSVRSLTALSRICRDTRSSSRHRGARASTLSYFRYYIMPRSYTSEAAIFACLRDITRVDSHRDRR